MLRLLLTVWVMFIATACGSGGGNSNVPSGITQVTVGLGQTVAAGALAAAGTVPQNIQSISVSVYDATGQLITGPTYANAPTLSISLNLANGNAIRFVILAFDAVNGGGNQVYHGESTTNLTGGAVTLPVKMNLTVAISPKRISVQRGQLLRLTATVAAAAPAATSPLLWTATGGQLVVADALGSAADWTAPAIPGTVTIDAKVNPAVNTSQDPAFFGSSTITVVNQSPIAVDDYAATQGAAIATISPMLNDSDPEGDAINIAAVTQGALGSVLIHANGTIGYTANAGAIGTDRFTYTISDVYGAQATATVFITLNDTIAPTITTPTPITVEATSATGVAISLPAIQSFIAAAVASDNIGVASLSNNAGAQFPLGATIVSFTARDLAGNQTVVSSTVTVVDTTAPRLTPPANIIVAAVNSAGTPNSNATITGFLNSATAIDAVSGNVAVTHNGLTMFPLGTTTVTFSARDAYGNVSTASSTITVNDLTPPVVIAPADVYVEATAPLTPVILGTATVNDNVDTGLIASNNSTASFPVGASTVTWRASDAYGNVGTATQQVVISDTTAPIVTAPTSIIVAAVNGAGTPASNATIASFLTAASANDLLDGNIIPKHNGLATFPLGTTTVTFSATDAKANRGTATATVTVVDQTKPVVSVPANITVAAVDAYGAPASHATIASFLGAATANDNVDGAITPSNNAPTQFPLGVTTVTFSATDAYGNTGSAAASVTVQNQSAPTVTPPANLTVAAVNASGTAASDPYITAFLNGATAVDLLGNVLTVSNNGLTQFPLGITTVTFSATDVYANTGTATATITVRDQTSPIVIAPAAIIVAAVDAYGTPASDPYIATFLNGATAQDNVNPNPTISNNAAAQLPLGTTTVIFSANDGYGNIGTASSTITVNDLTPPMVIAPADVYVEATAPLTPVILGSATVSDNVDAAITASPSSTGPFPLGTTTITWQAVDRYGNVATAPQHVIVQDTTAPVINQHMPLLDVYVEATGVTTPYAFTTPPVNDAYGVATMVVNNNGPFPVGTSTVIWTATDLNGLSATATQRVIVNHTPVAGLFKASFQHGVNGYMGGQDAELRQDLPDTNVGNASFISIDGSNDGSSLTGMDSMGLMQFSHLVGALPGQIPAGATVRSATLQTFVISGGDSVDMRHMLLPWDEYATWNSSNTAVNNATLLRTLVGRTVSNIADANPLGTSGVFQTFDVYSDVQNWVNGVDNYGWAFTPSNPLLGDGVDFASREAATISQRPLLQVEYISPTLAAKTAANTPLSLQLSGVDADGQALTTIVQTLPLHGQLYQTTDGITLGVPINVANTTVSDVYARVIYVPTTTFSGRDNLSFVVNDSIASSAPASLTIHVDAVAPTILLNGVNPAVVAQGQPYIDAGATANDNVDGNLTAAIVVNNSVNTAVAGTYPVTYQVMDAAGNDALITRMVKVNAAPIAGVQQRTFQNGLNGYNGVQDTELNESTPASILGANPSVTIDGGFLLPSSTDTYAMLRFGNLIGAAQGQIPLGSTVLDAALDLYIISGGDHVDVVQLLSNWDQATATWATDSAKVMAGSYLTRIAGRPLAGMPLNLSFVAQTFNVTTAVQNWVAGAGNFGLGFRPFSTLARDGVDFATSESTLYPTPAMRISYIDPYVYIAGTSTITLAGFDANGDTLSAQVTALPLNGLLYQTSDGVTPTTPIIAANTVVSDVYARVIYVPNNPTFIIPDSLQYIVNDGTVNSAVATFNLKLSNLPPVITSPIDPYTLTVAQDRYANFTVIANDPNGDPLTWDLYSAASNGVATVDAYGNVSYISNRYYSGADSFVVRTSDPYGLSTLLNVQVTVSPTHVVIATVNGNNSISGINCNTTWTAAQSPYWLQSNVTVAAGCRLQIDAYTVVKLDPNIQINVAAGGVLDVYGTQLQPVYFTSIKDDSVGGDLNGDGILSLPTAGDWQNIYYAANAGGTLQYAELRYGGSNAPWGGLYLAAPIQANGLTVSHSAGHNLVIDGNAAPIISNSRFDFATTEAIYLTSTSNGIMLDASNIISNATAAYLSEQGTPAGVTATIGAGVPVVQATGRIEVGVTFSSLNAAQFTAWEAQIGRPLRRVQRMYNLDEPAWLWNTEVPNMMNLGFKLMLTLEPKLNSDIYANSPSRLQAITAGSYDAAIDLSINGIINNVLPVYPNADIWIRIGQEMNGDWYPWGGLIDAYGNPHNGNAAADYIAAFQHIVQRYRAAGLGENMVKFVWSPNVWPSDNFTMFYPGDSYADYIGMSGFNFGPNTVLHPTLVWQSFNTIFNFTYNTMLSTYPFKQITIGGISSAESGGSKAAWVNDMAVQLSNAYPSIVSVFWFNIDKTNIGETNWRIDSSPSSLTAVQQMYLDNTLWR
jgi:hypothetical protein